MTAAAADFAEPLGHYPVTETRFGSLKVERLHGLPIATRRQASAAGIDWPLLYNHRRLHATPGYLGPMTFAKKRLADKERLAASSLSEGGH